MLTARGQRAESESEEAELLAAADDASRVEDALQEGRRRMGSLRGATKNGAVRPEKVAERGRRLRASN